jgi:hypothetical protein
MWRRPRRRIMLPAPPPAPPPLRIRLGQLLVGLGKKEAQALSGPGRTGRALHRDPPRTSVSVCSSHARRLKASIDMGRRGLVSSPRTGCLVTSFVSLISFYSKLLQSAHHPRFRRRVRSCDEAKMHIVHIISIWCDEAKMHQPISTSSGY